MTNHEEKLEEITDGINEVKKAFTNLKEHVKDEKDLPHVSLSDIEKRGSDTIVDLESHDEFVEFKTVVEQQLKAAGFGKLEVIDSEEDVGLNPRVEYITQSEEHPWVKLEVTISMENGYTVEPYIKVQHRYDNSGHSDSE